MCYECYVCYAPEGQEVMDRKVKRFGPEGRYGYDRKVYRDSGWKSPKTYGLEDPVELWPGKAYLWYVVFWGTH